MSAATALRVRGGGICCAIGYNAAAADCALRAGVDHFQESEFVAGNGEPVRVARLPDSELWGLVRLAQWVRYAVGDAVAATPDFTLAETPVMLLTQETTRPHGDDTAQAEMRRIFQQALETRFHASSRHFPKGRAGLGEALEAARQLLNEGRTRQVLLIGADSYLNAATINHYLREERLLIPGNSDGFLPGEAAAALLLEKAAPHQPGLYITGIGRAHETGRPDGSEPSRALGLTEAMRAALAQAGATFDSLGFELSDLSGEAFFARESANAMTRIAAGSEHSLELLTTADCTGEIGAATGPLMLAWLARLLPRRDAPGRSGLLHLANDDGERCAIIAQYRPLT